MAELQVTRRLCSSVPDIKKNIQIVNGCQRILCAALCWDAAAYLFFTHVQIRAIAIQSENI